MTSKELAILFHNTYEILAPKFGYETREDTKNFDENSSNGKLMIAVCEVVLKVMRDELRDEFIEDVWNGVL